jgi:hypothetical protein
VRYTPKPTRRLDPPEYRRAFPRPLVKMAYIPSGCLCSWGWTPDLGGTKTPFVLKYVHNGYCYTRHPKPKD